MDIIKSPADVDINRLRIMTYNIWFAEDYRNERLISLIETINQHGPDIVCLQEVIPPLFDHLKICFTKEYPYIFPNRLDGKYHCIILSKYPFMLSNEHEFINTTMGRKLLYIVINLRLVKEIAKDFSVENFKLVIATAHYESQFGIYNKRKIDQYMKSKEILEDLSKQYGPVILCADTNISSDIDEEKYYLTHDDKWIDCWIETGSDKELEYTYDSKTNDNLKNRNLNKEYRGRIDRIIYIKNSVFKTVKFDLIKGVDYFIEPSDHYGIMATFEFNL